MKVKNYITQTCAQSNLRTCLKTAQRIERFCGFVLSKLRSVQTMFSKQNVQTA